MFTYMCAHALPLHLENSLGNIGSLSWFFPVVHRFLVLQGLKKQSQLTFVKQLPMLAIFTCILMHQIINRDKVKHFQETLAWRPFCLSARTMLSLFYSCQELDRCDSRAGHQVAADSRTQDSEDTGSLDSRQGALLLCQVLMDGLGFAVEWEVGCRPPLL